MAGPQVLLQAWHDWCFRIKHLDTIVTHNTGLCSPKAHIEIVKAGLLRSIPYQQCKGDVRNVCAVAVNDQTSSSESLLTVKVPMDIRQKGQLKRVVHSVAYFFWLVKNLK